MKAIEVEKSTLLYGLTIRTKNADEMNPSTAKIGSVWQKFFSEVAPSLREGAKVYGVYSNYESDASGEFDVTACTDQEVPASSGVTLKSGHYLVFSATGEMPRTVIETWQEIWKYFSIDRSDHKRTYLTDYEFYKSGQEIEVYIGIE
jgi:predicted transcriptional regulator YdeE